MIFAGSFFANASYGVLLATMRETTENSVPAELRNMGHNVSDAVYSSFSGAVSLTYAGFIADKAGVDGMLLVCIATVVIPVALSIFYRGKGARAAQG